MTRITAAVFDLGGVLIDWNPEYLYEKLIPDPVRRHEFLTTVCTSEWNYEMDQGRAVPEAVESLAATHHEAAPLIEAWWTRWSEMLGGEVPGTLAIVEALARTGLPLYGLTNWSAETWPRGVERFPFLEELFDGIVVSGRERVAKPDPQVFEILNRRYGLDPAATAFVDDSPANIETADALGYATHRFTGAGLLRDWFSEIGLLIAS
ncbi:MAG: HAD family phosphatase [Actinomycetota bacterium]